MTFSDSAVSFSRQILPLGQETSTKSNHKKFSHLYIQRKKKGKKKRNQNPLAVVSIRLRMVGPNPVLKMERSIYQMMSTLGLKAR